MTDDNIQPINDPKEIPSGLSDEEQLAYWETHGLTEEYLQKTEEVPEEERPRARTSPISVRFDAHTLIRLKSLAERRGVGYQTLLKEFVTERLYEEEKREGVTPFDPRGVNEGSTTSYSEFVTERLSEPEPSLEREEIEQFFRASFYHALESQLSDLSDAAWRNYNWLWRKASSSSRRIQDKEQRN
jgi:hypothetical protein